VDRSFSRPEAAAYGVCKYQGARVRRLGGPGRRGKGVPRPAKTAGVTVETGLLAGTVPDHQARRTTTTPLLYRDPAAASNYASQKAANGCEGDVRRKRKDVNEWFV